VLDASKEIAVKVNAYKMNCVFIFYLQNTGKYFDINMCNKLYENVQIFWNYSNRSELYSLIN
jgi:hypothetical protein